MMIKVYTDGASRGNPGPSSYGYLIKDKDDKVIKEGFGYIGITTNNVAEYTAVLEAFKFIKSDLKVREVNLFADSKLIIEQLSGRFKIKSSHLKLIYKEIKDLEENFPKVNFKHIPRTLNFLADKLANIALDKIP